MDAFVKARRPLRTQLTKKMNELDLELSRDTPDRTVVQVKLELLNKCFEKVDTIDQDSGDLKSCESKGLGRGTR